MKAITISKTKLLDVIKANREKHRAIFLEAQTGYRLAAIIELDKMLVEARSGKRIRRAVKLIEPIDQTSEYDRVIRMLEMSEDSTILLEEHDFRQYVLDDWAWKGQFNASNRLYSKSLDDQLIASTASDEG